MDSSDHTNSGAVIDEPFDAWASDAPPPDATSDPDDGDDGDDGAQPWWKRPINIVALVVTAALCAGMIGWSFGSSNQQRHNQVDVGFLQDMRVHHEQATLMSYIYLSRPNIDPRIANVATGILQGQNIEIGRMVQQLRVMKEAEARDNTTPAMLWMGMSADQNQMPGMATEAQLSELSRSDGAEADELFVTMMNRHHEGGIEMADFAAANGANEEVRLMADSMAHSQRGEIIELTNLIG